MLDVYVVRFTLQVVHTGETTAPGGILFGGLTFTSFTLSSSWILNVSILTWQIYVDLLDHNIVTMATCDTKSKQAFSTYGL